MKINREKLLKSLEAVSSGLSQREILEQSNHFVFQGGRVITFNDEVSVSIKAPLDLEGTVVAVPLMSLLRKLKEVEVDIEIADGELLIKGDRRKAGIRMEVEVTLPIDCVETPEGWKKLPKDFLEALEIVQQCCGTDESKFVLTCVHLAPDMVEASDDSQICRYPLKTGMEKPSLVRRVSLNSVIGADVTEFSETENWLHFRNPSGLILSCRRYAAKYPSEQIGKIMDFEGTPTSLPKELVDAVDKAEVFSSEGDDLNQVTVELRSDKMKVSGRGANGWFSQILPTKYDGDEMSFTIAPKLLVEIVKRTDKCEIAEGKIKVDGKKFTYVSSTGKVGD